MIRHTPETVRAACERAGMPATIEPEPRHYLGWYIGHGRQLLENTSVIEPDGLPQLTSCGWPLSTIERGEAPWQTRGEP